MAHSEKKDLSSFCLTGEEDGSSPKTAGGGIRSVTLQSCTSANQRIPQEFRDCAYFITIYFITIIRCGMSMFFL